MISRIFQILSRIIPEMSERFKTKMENFFLKCVSVTAVEPVPFTIKYYAGPVKYGTTRLT